MAHRIVVRRGETLSDLARRTGVSETDLWSTKENRVLRDRGREPNLLAQGDAMTVPDIALATDRVVPGTMNRYVARPDVRHFRLLFRGIDGPHERAECTITGLEEEPLARVTDGQGVLAFDAPPHVREVVVEFPSRDVVYRVLLGDLEPVETPRGVVQRLANLGFLDPDATSASERAIAAFQRSVSLEPTGVICETTREELRLAHGR